MQETAFDASAAAGYDLDRYRELQRAWLVRETDITYLRPLVYNDRFIVKTWVPDFRWETDSELLQADLLWVRSLILNGRFEASGQ
jgi:hypothetical protein